MSQGWRAGRILAGPSGRSSRAVRAGCAADDRGASPCPHARSASVRGALLAATEQVHLVPFDRESAGRLLFAVARATEPVEHAVAVVATEVVVMLHARALVARRFSRQFHL